MTYFDVGERYTRDQVREAAGLPPMTGGDWATGYAKYGGEVFVFCNIGVAGRTGHDYPNRWIDNALDWFGKTGSSANQPMVAEMISGTVTCHVFWRGRDRGPFTYAGVGIPQGFWGEKPVEVLWGFDGSAPSTSATSGTSPRLEPTLPGASAFHHGPPPSFGLKQLLAQDGPCRLYMMVLEGAVDELFPVLKPLATNRSVIKVGISKDPWRRERELNVGFPRGATAKWVVRQTRMFDTVGDAYAAEGAVLGDLSDSGRWISGEFAIVAISDLGTLLG